MEYKHVLLCSDLHLEVDIGSNKTMWLPEHREEYKETILVIAGDIAPDQLFLEYNGYSWITEVCSLFAHVIVVLGNHDYWGRNINTLPSNIREWISKNLDNCTLLENNAKVLGGFKFIGATLWTDFNNNDIGTKNLYEAMLVDAKAISGEYNLPLLADTVHRKHIESIQYIKENTVRDYDEQCVIVVTHHAPSTHSIDPRYFGDILNHCFISDYDEMIRNMDIDYWLHGHVHHAFDYHLGKCRVICNPRGYHENESFIDGILKEII